MPEYKAIVQGSNSHILEFAPVGGITTQRFLLASDLHWDNPKCRRDILKRHLDAAVEQDALILLNGDTFCLMQGRYDPRSSKSAVRPEHQTDMYFDAILETAVDYFKPYAEHIAWIGYGNHETSVAKRAETDLLKMFVKELNREAAPATPVVLGAYGSWINFRFQKKKSTSRAVFQMYAFHGSGGGGEVTKGIIQMQRKMAMLGSVDAAWQGHVHELYALPWAKVRVNQNGDEVIEMVWAIRSSTYKEEFAAAQSKGMGWHIQRGAPPKPIGSVWLDLTFKPKKGIIESTCSYAM